MRPTVTLSLAGCLRGNLGITEKVNGTFFVYKSKAEGEKKERERTELIYYYYFLINTLSPYALQ